VQEAGPVGTFGTLQVITSEVVKALCHSSESPSHGEYMYYSLARWQESGDDPSKLPWLSECLACLNVLLAVDLFIPLRKGETMNQRCC
jgi:hypothetical protein